MIMNFNKLNIYNHIFNIKKNSMCCCCISFFCNGCTRRNFIYVCYFLNTSNIKINDTIKKEECAICLNILDKNVVKTICNHKFHYKCLYRWNLIKNECPLCRNPIIITI